MNKLAQVSNPFRDTIVSDAWNQAKIDLEEINREAFDTCMAAFHRVSTGQGSDSVLLHGPAGSGKTHLLARIRLHLVSNAVRMGDNALRCIFTAVKLQTSSEMLWQHLRKRLADDLLKEQKDHDAKIPGSTTSQLQRLIAHYLAAGGESRTARDWLTELKMFARGEQEHGHIESMLGDVASRAALSYDLTKVMGALLLKRNLVEARAWLRGDPVPEEALERLGVSNNERDPEDLAREFVLSVCRLAENSLPIVLCFDQVEAVQMRSDDETSFFPLGQMLADLFTADDNILLITCIQSALLDLFRRSVREADLHRFARRETVLNPLDRAAAQKLVERRLESCSELVGLRRENASNPLWPMTVNDMNILFESPPHRVPARKVLMHFERGFDLLQNIAKSREKPIPIEIVLEAKLEAKHNARLLEYATSDTEQNIRHGLPLLTEALGSRWRTAKTSNRDIHLAFEDRFEGKAIELSVLNEKNMTSLAAVLKRLVARKSQADHLIVRDPRIPVTKGAVKCREHMATLKKRGVRFIEPDVEVLALLDAIRIILSEARAGDLTHDGEPICVETVEQWLREALDPRLQDLVDDLLPAKQRPHSPLGPDGTTVAVQDLAALMAERFIVSMEQAASELRMTPQSLEDLVRAYPTRFGLLAGPPAVLFFYMPPSLGNRRAEEMLQ